MVKPTKGFLENQRGFTIAELLTTIALLMISFIVIANVFGFGIRTMQDINDRSKAEREARSIINNLTWELRTSTFTESGLPVLKTATGDEIVFYRSVDEDSGPSQIHYFVQDSKLFRGIIKASSSDPPWTYTGSETLTPIAGHIRNTEENPLFVYLNEDLDEFIPGSESDLWQVSLVRLNIVIDVDPEKTPEPYTIQSEIHLRNQR